MSWLRVATIVTVALSTSAGAQTFPVFSGDPVDSSTRRAVEALPGQPFFLPQPNGKWTPPIVDTAHHGDVDLVVRASSGFVGPTMPPAVAVPPTGIAGGTRVVAGREIPFTVITSDGDSSLPAGRPLFGPEMNGIPVVVAAFADLDGDGWIGPTGDDAEGLLDDGRELQELFPVGRQLAVFVNGVAQGSVATFTGAPASAGGLGVVLTALAYVGPFSPAFMVGNVPDGPGVATALPFFPDLDPRRIIEGRGRGGPAGDDVRFGVEIVPVFDPPVNDPVLGTPFALRTDGASSPTVDRALSIGGPYSRMHFVRPSDVADFPVPAEVPLHRGAAGMLYQDLLGVDIRDDGPGNPVHARLVPVDLLDNITDPPTPEVITLVASNGLQIATPDLDGDPSRETLTVEDAAGVDVVLEDTGRANDGPPSGRLTVVEGGVPTETLAVTFARVTTGGGGGGGGSGPTIRFGGLDPSRLPIVIGCRADRTLVAVATDPDADLTGIQASILLNGQMIAAPRLRRGDAPVGLQLPAGDVFVAPVSLRAGAMGALGITLVAEDAALHHSAPLAVGVQVVTSAGPALEPPTLAVQALKASTRAQVLVTAAVSDDCGVGRVSVEADAGKGFRRAGKLGDLGKRGDAVAGDGIFSGFARFPKTPPGTIAMRIVARNSLRLATVGETIQLPVVP